MAKRKDHTQKKKSICEISMMLVANIISLSSVRFSGPSCFTTNNLTPQTQDDDDAPSSTTSSPIITKLSHKSQRFERATKPRSYLQNPELVVNNNDPYNYVDISAGNYIRRVHDKIHQGANSNNNNTTTTKRFPIFAIPCSTSSYKYC
ncbi:hypothetical protein PIB30_118397 [Stylosanthes scabra]|uniref:Uncharacterized protein n=1 Tax=Stylosanthes scabra TaxID=79078 RepID=A0ABU6U2M8_9FABA|nr:hypothetical protein [Stylosanthes scabra]